MNHMTIKHIKTAIAIIASWVTILGCSKKDTPVNWKEALRGTAWGGEFRYTTGPYVGPQAFSILFNFGTFTWYDLSGNYNGNWMVDSSNLLSLQFSSGVKLTARIEKERWSDIKNITSHNWQLVSVQPAVIPETGKLENTTWKGTWEGTDDYSITFLPGNIIKTKGPGGNITASYTIAGAGILWNYFNFEKNYGVLVNHGNKLLGIYNIPSTNIWRQWNVSQ
jgi:hypothetical protein